MSRLSLLLRGPGLLLLLLCIGVAGTSMAHRESQSTPATPAPVLFFLSVSGNGAVDHGTGMTAHVSDARVSGLPTAGKIQRLSVSLQITLRNLSHRAHPVDSINFYALAASGQTYGTEPRTTSAPSLHHAVLAPGRVLFAWITFVEPAAPERLTVLWNDSNQLLPPGAVADVSIVRAHTS